MSIFLKKSNPTQVDIEKALFEMYTKMLSQIPVGMNEEQIHMEVKKAIVLCKEMSIKEGTYKLPNNYGDLLVKAAKNGDLKAQKIVVNARKEGAVDEDICEFWNLNDLQRRMVFWSENLFRYSSFLSFSENGLNPDDTMAKIRKMFPMYGNPEDTQHVSGDDRPLPHELRNRVDKYRMKHGSSCIKDKVKNFSTYNAFVREEIRRGNL